MVNEDRALRYDWRLYPKCTHSIFKAFNRGGFEAVDRLRIVKLGLIAEAYGYLANKKLRANPVFVDELFVGISAFYARKRMCRVGRGSIKEAVNAAQHVNHEIDGLKRRTEEWTAEFALGQFEGDPNLALDMAIEYAYREVNSVSVVPVPAEEEHDAVGEGGVGEAIPVEEEHNDGDSVGAGCADRVGERVIEEHDAFGASSGGMLRSPPVHGAPRPEVINLVSPEKPETVQSPMPRTGSVSYNHVTYNNYNGCIFIDSKPSRGTQD